MSTRLKISMAASAMVFGIACFFFYQLGKSNALQQPTTQTTPAQESPVAEVAEPATEQPKIDQNGLGEMEATLRQGLSKLHSQTAALKKQSAELEASLSCLVADQKFLNSPQIIKERMALFGELPHPKRLPEMHLKLNAPQADGVVKKDYEKETGITPEQIQSLMDQ